ncbi:hypothetical protein PQR07_40850, partial [Paraburkholderia aspalathi]
MSAKCCRIGPQLDKKAWCAQGRGSHACVARAELVVGPIGPEWTLYPIQRTWHRIIALRRLDPVPAPHTFAQQL